MATTPNPLTGLTGYCEKHQFSYSQASCTKCFIEAREGNNARYKVLAELLQWATERLNLETANRPDTNIHKRTLVETWCQVIRKFEEELRLSSR